ncbi:MAG: type I methionyl aminopeptidase [Endozoicomonadaceae bacterium]|nr:type I methionyl aminopeptidase [Endozoicomonadaceae bacterium]
MSVVIKTAEEIEKMRIAGRLAADLLEMITPHVKVGVSTGELDTLCHDYIVNVQQAIPAPLNYGMTATRPGFPKSICTSVNEVVCHGIPGDTKFLKNGDILNLDVTVKKDGYHGDTSMMFLVGDVSPHAKRLSKITRECMYKGIEQVKPGAYLGDIGAAIAKHAHAHYFSVVEDFCGHGIGKAFHEEPQVLHIGKKNTGIQLKEGMIFTIEPMINLGKKHVKIKKDGWTAVTKDRRLSAQWEHTILVTATGAEILTLRTGEVSPFTG